MEFLDKLILPQSLEHTTLLHFLSLVVLMMFIPFIAQLFGALLFAVLQMGKAGEGDKRFEQFARSTITISSLNGISGLALGFVPALILALTYSQILHTIKNDAPLYFLIASIALLTGLYFTHRFKNSHPLSRGSGIYGLVFIGMGLFFVSGALTLAIFAPSTETAKSFSWLFFSTAVYSRFIAMIISGIVLSAAFLLFRYCYWEGGIPAPDASFREYEQNALYKGLFVGLILLGIFITLNVVLLPAPAVSAAGYLCVLLADICLFIAAHQLYALLKGRTGQLSGAIIIFAFFAVFLSILSDQSALSKTTYKNALLHALTFEEAKKELEKQTGGSAVMSGQEIYTLRCASCHKFDVKVVGPPYKETLSKYADDPDKLVSFIKNPVKVNPAYPPMPALGLKPAEARAVAKYLLEEFKKY